MTCFIVDKDTPGLEFGAKEKKVDTHTQPSNIVCANDQPLMILYFTQCNSKIIYN